MFKSMNLKVKILSGFFIVIMLGVLISFFSFYSIERLNNSISMIMDINNLGDNLTDMVLLERDYIAYGSDESRKGVVELIAMVKKQAVKIKDNMMDNSKKQEMNKILSAMSLYESEFNKYIETKRATGEYGMKWRNIASDLDAEAGKMLNDILKPKVSQYNKKLNKQQLFWQNALDKLNNDVRIKFLQMTLAGERFVSTQSDENWKFFENGAREVSNGIAQWSRFVSSDKNLTFGAKSLNKLIDRYIALGNRYHNQFLKQVGIKKNLKVQSVKIARIGKSLIDSSITDIELVSKNAKRVMFGVSGAAIIFGLILAFLITRSVTEPIHNSVRFAEAIAEGDLTGKMMVKNNDEVGRLIKSLNSMSDNLNNMVLQIQEGAEQVASSSEQLASTTQMISESAQVQASTLEETSASMEELSASIEQVADHAQTQSAAVEEMSGSMEQMGEMIEQVNSALGKVEEITIKSVNNAEVGTQKVGEVIKAISDMAEKSKKISSIADVISDIADQTNLLALNASIEAARAGEHGRGFAIVANEISKLADRSSESTKEIINLIEESERAVASGVIVGQKAGDAMKGITEEASKTIELMKNLKGAIEQQNMALKEMAKALENINEMSQSIGAATEEQSINAKQVSKAIESLNETTQEAAASAEQMAASTEELSGMAQELQALGAKFKINNSLIETTVNNTPTTGNYNRFENSENENVEREIVKIIDNSNEAA